jgi:hypothetical protein
VTTLVPLPTPVLEAVRATLLHADHGTSISVTTRLAVGAVGGLVATVAMWRQRYGYVPASVAAGALGGDPPNEVSRWAAHLTYLAAGTIVGGVYEAINVGVYWARGQLGLDVEYRIADVVTVAEVLVGVGLVIVLYGIFSWLVFPRFGGNAYETRPTTVRRQWLGSAAVHGGSLVVVVGISYDLLPI